MGVSGDGDSASIGIGQLIHAIRRNMDMVYIVENNGVYGLTKGQYSATADIGSKKKKGAPNEQQPIDLCALAINLGCTFVARSFWVQETIDFPAKGSDVSQRICAYRCNLALCYVQQ